MEDRVAYLEDKLRGVAGDLASGRSDALWGLVRELSGKRGASRLSAAFLSGLDGVVLASSESVVAAWVGKFFTEFGGNGIAALERDLPGTVAFTPFAVQRSPVDAAEWGRRLRL